VHAITHAHGQVFKLALFKKSGFNKGREQDTRHTTGNQKINDQDVFRHLGL